MNITAVFRRRGILLWIVITAILLNITSEWVIAMYGIQNAIMLFVLLTATLFIVLWRVRAL